MSITTAPKIIQVPKSSIKCIHVLSFWNEYFPNDPETYNLRITATGLILSFLAVHVVSEKLSDSRFFDATGIFLMCGYIVMVAWVSNELYNGLKIADPKRYTTWIIVKVFEIFLIVASCVYGIFDGILPIMLVYSVVVLMFDSFSTFIVIKLWQKQLHQHGTCLNIKRNKTQSISLRV
ncbi:uncharacterized protein LOC123004794 [Tribolium madens]|uniref:uncharacterized protein LOC123004794 n=1 Tax=Tribolium madens TaxID=41895 RepID=UPI001CF74EAB|nr:uncharacterized protein LOC123004794 [Tribolium madens]